MTLLEKAAIAHKEAVAIKEQYTEGIGVHHPATRLREMACMIEVLAGLVEAMAAGPEPFLLPWQTRVIDEAVALANVREKEAGAEETRLKWIEGSRVSHEPEVEA